MSYLLFCSSVCVSAVVLLYWLVIPEKWRSLFLLFCSFIFISLLHVRYAICFSLMTVVVYFAGNIIIRYNRWGKMTLRITLAFLIINLFLHKYFLGLNPKIFLSYLNNSTTILWPLGMSYVTFRLIHYIVEVYRKNVPVSSFVDFGSYVLFFPAFLAGPVERFPKFHSQTAEKKKFDIANVNYGLYRIICGIIKKCIIADTLARIIRPVLQFPENYTRAVVILVVYGLAIRIYMDFAGYTDMAIGIARLFGYKIMENFNRPFFQKNIALFWRNWHISVYSWIRDYFFFPLFGYRASNIKIYFGIFCTMIVFMLWHEISLSFLVLGIYHGLGVVVWHIFQEIKRKYSLVHRVTAKGYLDPIATFFTFNFVSFGFVFFGLEVGAIGSIIHRIFC